MFKLDILDALFLLVSYWRRTIPIHSLEVLPVFEFTEEAGAAWAMHDWLLEYGATSALVLQVADGYLVLWSTH